MDYRARLQGGVSGVAYDGGSGHSRFRLLFLYAGLTSIELPISTGIMLRSIAVLGRAEGVDGLDIGGINQFHAD